MDSSLLFFQLTCQSKELTCKPPKKGQGQQDSDQNTLFPKYWKAEERGRYYSRVTTHSTTRANNNFLELSI
jgi:hypothetical protein